MKAASWLWLLRRDVLSQKSRLALLVACVALTATILGLTVSAISYLRGELRPRLRELFPERRVIVRPASSELLMLRMEGPKIDGPTLEFFRGLPEVEHVYPQMAASFPVSAAFDMESVGMGFETDIIMFGVERGLIEKNLALPNIPFDATSMSEDRLPVLVSEYFLDAYNLGLAESAGMPKLSRGAFLGIEFEILLGESTIGLGTSVTNPQEIKARVSGMTANPLLFGVIIPLDAMKEYNRRYSPANADKYAILHIDMRSPEDLEAVRVAAQERRLAFTAQKEVLDKYLKVVSTIEAVLLAFLVSVMALSAVGVFTTTAASIRERRAAWGLHRATGMKPGGVLALALGHSIAASLPAAFLATVMAAIISAAIKHLLASYADISLVPANPVPFSTITLTAIWMFSMGFAGVPALLYALPIARARPVVLLAERSL